MAITLVKDLETGNPDGQALIDDLEANFVDIEAAVNLNTLKVTANTANVTAAGAVMDSELASEADVKALDQSVASGAAPTFAGTNFSGTASGLTAGNVTTNANLTGDVTSVGNATTIAVDAVDIPMLSATGTASGSTFLRGDNTWATPSGGGDVAGPASSVDGRLALFDSTTGKLLKQSTTIADDGSGNLSGVGTIAATAATADSIAINGSTSGTVTLDVPAVAGSNTFTIPAATDQAVGRATTDTLTNKEIVYDINAQTGTTYTLVAGDGGQVVTMSNASANTLTIPLNASVAFPVGTIMAITMLGAGTTTVTGDTGVTVNGVSAGGAAIDAQYKGVTLTKLATDTWVMQGAHGTVS